MKFRNITLVILSLMMGIMSCQQPVEQQEVQKRFNSIEEQVTYQRAFEAVVWAMPATAIHRLREAFHDLPGVTDNVIIAFSEPGKPRHKAITVNAVTPYSTCYTDLSNGPIVLDVPAKSDKATLYGQVVDAWQMTITGVGPAGADKGKGGKYLFLPPGYDGEVPEGYFVVPCSTYRLAFVFRAIREKGATDKDADEYNQRLKIYNLGEEKETKFVDGIPHPLESLPFYDHRAMQVIYDIVSVEPVKERDKVMMGMLETIGIKPGEPFNPTDREKEIFDMAAKDAYEYMHNLVYKHHEEGIYWENRNWSWVMRADDNGRFDFITDDAIQIDRRAAAWNFFTLYPKQMDERPATIYMAPIKDSEDRPLEAGKLYKITIPENIPVSQFWSVTVYDDATWAWIDNEQQRPGLGQFNLPDMEVNKDGSVDVYFGPEPPTGMESNWIPTAGKKPYIWLRLYGPTEPFWDKSFVMPDVEMVR
ncbi:MAG: DUF1254 domain-containing protein [Bacteroidales bacterium]|nr:DUF1254 domain-containing protein [Bacteroidales bacterium]